MVGIDIQSLFADIIQSPGQRRQSLTAQGERDAVTATRGLTGRSQIFAPLVGALASSQGMRDEMLQRSLGGLFGLDTRNESEKLQQALQGADISTEAGQNALLEQVGEVSPAHAAKLQQEFAERRMAQQRLQENVLANNTLVDTSTLDDTKQASVRRIIAANPSMEPDKVVTIIKNMGGMPKEEVAPTFTVRTASVLGEEGLQTVKINNRDGSITRDVLQEDGTFKEERLPSSSVELRTSSQVENLEPVQDPRNAQTSPASSGGLGLFDYVGDAVGATSWAANLYNESPLADVFGLNQPVADARAKFAVFENNIMNMYKRSSRPSNWQEQRLLRLLPKPGPLESQGSAIAKLHALRRDIQNQYDYEIQEFAVNSGNRAKQQEHSANARDLERLLMDFNEPNLENVPEVVFSEEEGRRLPPGTQYYLDGKLFTAEPVRLTSEDDVEALPPGTPFLFGNETIPRVRR